jgi:hypothetical protein
VVFGGAWRKGDLVAVVPQDGWAPCAVGRFAMAFEDGTRHHIALYHTLNFKVYSSGYKYT